MSEIDGPAKLPGCPFGPLGDRILVRPDPVGETLKGSRIILPRATQAALKKQMQTGTVLATGPGMLMANGGRWPMPVKPGERLVFMKDGPLPIRINGEDLLIMRDDFAMLVLEDEEEAAE